MLLQARFLVESQAGGTERGTEADMVLVAEPGEESAMADDALEAAGGWVARVAEMEAPLSLQTG